MSPRVDRMTAALDLASRLASGSGCAPTRSVTTEARMLAFALLDLECALRAVQLHDRTAVYLPGELRADGVVRLRRKLSLSGEATQTLWLRAAMHASLVKVDERTVRVGDKLRIDCGDTPFSIVTVAGQPEQELRLRIDLPGGGGTKKVTLEYGVEESK